MADEFVMRQSISMSDASLVVNLFSIFYILDSQMVVLGGFVSCFHQVLLQRKHAFAGPTLITFPYLAVNRTALLLIKAKVVRLLVWYEPSSGLFLI